MTAPPFLAEQVALLERTPGVVRTLLGGLPDSWLDERDTANGWQARDVVGHLISAELSDWIPRAEIIEEHGTSRPFDPFDRFEMLERDRGVPLDTLIDRFAELRQQSLARLHELVHDETDLDKRGLHPDPAIGEVTTAPTDRDLGRPRPGPRVPDLRGTRRQPRCRRWTVEGLPRNSGAARCAAEWLRVRRPARG